MEIAIYLVLVAAVLFIGARLVLRRIFPPDR
jgi:hypothetical protein